MAFNWIKFPWTNLHELNLDWIIQTVKTLEGNLADAIALVQTTVDSAITKLLTGSGDLTIRKTGDVNITGNSVQLSKTVITSGNEQLTMHNPTSNTSMGANYNSGTLTLTNKQNGAAGVAVSPVNTPADGGGDNSDFAANVGYVKTAVNTVSEQLTAETANRTSGDAALQSTIDGVIMPLINSTRAHTPFSLSIIWPTEADYYTITNNEYSMLRGALLAHRPIFVVRNTMDVGGEQTLYTLQTCTTPSEENIDVMTLVLSGGSGNGIKIKMANKSIELNI